MKTTTTTMRTFTDITEAFKKFEVQKIELANDTIAYCCKNFEDYFTIAIYSYRDINKFNNAIKRYIKLQ